MLNRDFVKWVVIAFVIATPIAYYAMNKWLENFANKTTLSWWIFALARFAGAGNCIANGELAKLEGSNEESGGDFTI
jgi:hypothetical protein